MCVQTRSQRNDFFDKRHFILNDRNSRAPEIKTYIYLCAGAEGTQTFALSPSVRTVRRLGQLWTLSVCSARDFSRAWWVGIRILKKTSVPQVEYFSEKVKIISIGKF